MEHQATILQKFRIHFHQHPELPLNDADGTHLSANEIHHGAAKDMYDYCREHDLAQVWAYMWNRWYTPNQWPLWARSAHPAIPRIKTTMIVESLWKHLKHRDLANYNRPRLDLVTHLVIENVLPRVRRRIAYVCGLRRIGRAKALAGWQTDFRAEWLDLGKTDEYRLVEKELEWRRKPKKTKGRTERLAQIDEEKNRPNGTYITNIDRWTCSCPSYLISRFLLCKHLVRTANTFLDDKPLDSLDFFFNLRRNHYPPYYSVSGIHTDTTIGAQDNDTANMTIRVLGIGNKLSRNRTGENGDIDEGSDLTGDKALVEDSEEEAENVDTKKGDNNREIRTSEPEFVDSNSSHDDDLVERVSRPCISIFVHACSHALIHLLLSRCSILKPSELTSRGILLTFFPLLRLQVGFIQRWLMCWTKFSDHYEKLEKISGSINVGGQVRGPGRIPTITQCS
jgi:hypothetical protein